MLQGGHFTDLQFVAAATRALAKQLSRSSEVCQSEANAESCLTLS